MLDIHLQDWILKDRQTNNMFIMDAYNGAIQVKVRPAEKGAQVIIRRTIAIEHVPAIVKVIQKIMAGSPETKIPLIFSSFDKQSKQSRRDWVLTFEKDSKMCYRIHITDAVGGHTHVFSVRGRNDLSIGSDVMSDSDKSAAKMHDLLGWLESARIWAPAYTQPYDPNAPKKQWGNKGGNGSYQRGGYGNGGGGYNRGGNGGYNRPNNGSSYGGNGGGAPAPAPAAEDDTGLPF